MPSMTALDTAPSSPLFRDDGVFPSENGHNNNYEEETPKPSEPSVLEDIAPAAKKLDCVRSHPHTTTPRFSTLTHSLILCCLLFVVTKIEANDGPG